MSKHDLPVGWVWVKFGDVAKQIKDTVDPETSDLERYVAGGHMDTDDLKIRRWGLVGDGYLGPAFHRKFQKGQILYGSRRTYLRKVAVADFDGICANTTFVIEARPSKIHPPLLPFIMQSEPFVAHSINNSRGSTNPYINWKDIARYEFALPPLDEQGRIAEVLWGVENAINLFRKVATNSQVLNTAIQFHMLSQAHEYTKLQNLCNFATGKLDSNYAEENGKYPFFTCDPETLRINSFSFDTEAILLAGNNAQGIFPIKHYKGKFNAYQRTYVIKTKDPSTISYDYLMITLSGALERLRRLAIGSTTKYLTLKILNNLEIPFPPKEHQDKIVAFSAACQKAKSDALKHIDNLNVLKKGIIDTVM